MIETSSFTGVAIQIVFKLTSKIRRRFPFLTIIFFQMGWNHQLPWEPKTFIFRGYNSHILAGPKTFIFPWVKRGPKVVIYCWRFQCLPWFQGSWLCCSCGSFGLACVALPCARLEFTIRWYDAAVVGVGIHRKDAHWFLASQRWK